jgi:L-alanine-DL-glutamate epimerase-like enolase superfamily enzyme
VATLEEAVEVAEATSIPIAGDESVESRADAERALALGACRLAGVKLSKVGGPEEAIEIAEVLLQRGWVAARSRRGPRRAPPTGR